MDAMDYNVHKGTRCFVFCPGNSLNVESCSLFKTTDRHRKEKTAGGEDFPAVDYEIRVTSYLFRFLGDVLLRI